MILCNAMAESCCSAHSAVCRLYVIQVLLVCYARLPALALSPLCSKPKHVCGYSPYESRHEVNQSYLGADCCVNSNIKLDWTGICNSICNGFILLLKFLLCSEVIRMQHIPKSF